MRLHDNEMHPLNIVNDHTANHTKHVSKLTNGPARTYHTLQARRRPNFSDTALQVALEFWPWYPRTKSQMPCTLQAQDLKAPTPSLAWLCT